MGNSIIDVVLSTDNNYAQHCAVLIASILLNNQSKYTYHFHILDGGISYENKLKISKLQVIQDFSITFYSMKDYDFSFLPLNRKNISTATYYRLMLTKILPENIDKIIYLDCDIIVDGDLSEFWETDISEVFAGVIEDESSIRSTIKLNLRNYFNAGVLLLNIKKLREIDFIPTWLNYFKENELIIDLQDQDILNGVFNNNVKWLPLKWNANATLFTNVKYPHFYSDEEANIAKKERVIIHYTERFKPWSKKCYHPLRKLYYKYLLKTPFKIHILFYILIKISQIFLAIFSITNIENRRHKQITILGFKFKFRIGVSLFSYRFLSFLMSWIFPTKGDRKRFRNLCNDIDERKDILKAHKNYQKIIMRIKNRKDKIKVLFLVDEISKWKAQSLYDLMSKSDKFEPIIALSVLNMVHKGKDSTRNEIEADYEYFKSKGMNVVLAYKNHKFISLKEFKPDIVFYQQPWDLPKKHLPKEVGKHSLLYYIPYYVNNYGVYPIDYNKPFHKYMFRHYVLNSDWEAEYKKLAQRNNIYGLGHTFLDNFYLNQNKKTDKNYVIYAPHHSIHNSILGYGTFLHNGYQILEYAKAHPEINWVFKPHPQLKHILLKIGITKDKVNQYWSEWAKIGIVCEDLSYIDLFLDSKALITDCGSFLTEYFCTGKPLIHLLSNDCNIVPNRIARKNFRTFYQVHDLDEMYETFDKVLIQNIDDKKEERLKVLEESGLLNNYAAKNILEDIEETLGLQKTS